jgi:hypothetical protein
MTDTATPSPTRLESELAHRLALGWALRTNKPPREFFDRRAQVVLQEAHRLLPDYLRMDPEALAEHVAVYALPEEYTGRPHSDWCRALNGKPCTCEVEP